MEFQAEDIPKMCRICLKLKESFFLVPINAKLEEGSITELIRSCSNVDLLISDLLPTKICHQCLEQLRIAKEIKQRCTSSEANLKSFLNKNTSISSNAAPEFVNVIKSEENIDKPVFITREQESGHQSEDDKFRMHDFGDTPSVGSVTEPTAKLLQRARTLKIVIPKLDHRIDAGYDQMQFECHYCQELLPNRTHFLKHFALKHKSKRINHKCLLCGLHFRYKTGLTVHMKYHRNERNFKCQLCPRKYVMKIELTKHMKAHSSSDLVVCDKCYRIYNCNYFKKHKCKGTGLIKNDKSIIADLLVQYTCDQCGLEISGKQFLLKHIKRTHMVKELKKLHACTTCGKQFISGYDLTIHRRTHTGKKLLTCPNCGRTFIKQALLERHARSRACSINFSKCKICLKVFKSSKSFKTHQLRCTEEKQQAMKNAPLPVKK